MVVALVVAAGVAAGLGPSPVGAQEAEPTLVVSPSTDLVDGQVVQV